MRQLLIPQALLHPAALPPTDRPVKDQGRKKETRTFRGRSQGRHLELVEVVGAVSHGDIHRRPPVGQGAAHLAGGEVCGMHQEELALAGETQPPLFPPRPSDGAAGLSPQSHLCLLALRLWV